MSIGGGYTNGAKAQEEDLCRQFPTYFTSLSRARQQVYPYGPASGDRKDYSDVLWTPDIECRRAGEDEGYRILEMEERFKGNFVAAAAPNIRGGEIWDDEGVYDAMVNIFFAPKWADKETQVLVRIFCTEVGGQGDTGFGKKFYFHLFWIIVIWRC